MASHSPSRRPRPTASIAPPHAAPTVAPYSPPPIPAGYYDPALDASRAAASRGLLDTRQDLGLQASRSAQDYGFGVADVNQGYDRGIADINTQRGYTNADFTTGTTRTNEDYARNVGLLTRQFSQLGRQQGEQARKYGVTSGGIALLSAAKRAENQGIEQQGLDTSHTRTLADLTTGRDRAISGFDTAATRLGEDKSTGLGRLDVGYNRGVTDNTTGLARAGREDAFYGLDTEAAKAFQAAQAGYIAPTPPPAPALARATGVHVASAPNRRKARGR